MDNSIIQYPELTPSQLQFVKDYARALLFGYAFIEAYDSIQHTPFYHQANKNLMNRAVSALEKQVNVDLEKFFNDTDENDTQAIIQNLTELAEQLQQLDIHHFKQLKITTK